jgi:hypothetical protein
LKRCHFNLAIIQRDYIRTKIENGVRLTETRVIIRARGIVDDEYSGKKKDVVTQQYLHMKMVCALLYSAKCHVW